MSARSGAALVLVALAVLAGCGRVAGDVHAAPVQRIHVESVEALARTVPSTLAVTGTLEAVQRTELAANATGQVIAIGAERGQEIKRGAILAQLDVRLSTLQRDAAKAQADVSVDQAASASDECARAAKLAESGAIAPAELERQRWQCKIAQGGVAVSKVQAEVAARALSDSFVRAPFDGWVVDRFVDPGEFVMPSTQVATLVSLDPLRLRVSVPEAHLAALAEGAPVTFHVEAYPDRAYTATVLHVSPVVGSATRDVVADATVANPDRSLRPGMFATAEIAIGQLTVPAVPKSAIATADESTRLFVLRDGRIEERSVRAGAVLGTDVTILAGLAVGERVVSAPGPDVKNGAFAN